MNGRMQLLRIGCMELTVLTDINFVSKENDVFLIEFLAFHSLKTRITCMKVFTISFSQAAS